MNIKKVLSDHKLWVDTCGKEGMRADLQEANLSKADLQRADLQGANLSRADLQGANIDYACWPLCCGTRQVGVDARIAAQLAAHFCALDCDDPDYLDTRNAIMKFAQTSHRAKDLGL
jgi:uncharacterized protein YjbI with pentapeptide repeats